MLIVALIAAGLLAWLVPAVLIELSRQRRDKLRDRLELYQGPTLADEAERWLSDR